MSDQPITPNVAKAILDLNDKRLLADLKAGKTLSKAQVATLIARSQGDKRNMPATVATLSELAECLELSRRTVARWMHDKKSPGSEANGAYNVAAWLEYARGKKGQPEEDDKPTRKQKLAEEKDELEIRKLRVEIGILEKTHWPAAEVARNVHEMITAARYVILRLPQLAHHLYGRDLPQIRAVLEKEANVICQTLSENHWSKLVLKALPEPTPAPAEPPAPGPAEVAVVAPPPEPLPPDTRVSEPAPPPPLAIPPTAVSTPADPQPAAAASSYERPQDFELKPATPDVLPDAPPATEAQQ